MNLRMLLWVKKLEATGSPTGCAKRVRSEWAGAGAGRMLAMGITDRVLDMGQPPGRAGAAAGPQAAWILVRCSDRAGLLGEVAHTIAAHGHNILVPPPPSPHTHTQTLPDMRPFTGRPLNSCFCSSSSLPETHPSRSYLKDAGKNMPRDRGWLPECCPEGAVAQASCVHHSHLMLDPS